MLYPFKQIYSVKIGFDTVVNLLRYLPRQAEAQTVIVAKSEVPSYQICVMFLRISTGIFAPVG